MKYGIREICDVVLKAKSNQKIGNKIFYKDEPVLYFDTLKTSTMEGSATTVYAQGGRGNSRLVAWEGERTVTFTMEDALISPTGFAILSGAGLVEADKNNTIKVHTTEVAEVNKIGIESIETFVSLGTQQFNNMLKQYNTIKLVCKVSKREIADIVNQKLANGKKKFCEYGFEYYNNGILQKYIMFSGDGYTGYVDSGEYTEDSDICILTLEFQTDPGTEIKEIKTGDVKIIDEILSKYYSSVEFYGEGFKEAILQLNKQPYGKYICNSAFSYELLFINDSLGGKQVPIRFKEGSNYELIFHINDQDEAVEEGRFHVSMCDLDSQGETDKSDNIAIILNGKVNTNIISPEWFPKFGIQSFKDEKTGYIHVLFKAPVNYDTNKSLKYGIYLASYDMLPAGYTLTFDVIENSLTNYYDASNVYAMKFENGEAISEPYIPTRIVNSTIELNATRDDLNDVKVGDLFLVDYYTEVPSGAQQIEITPDKFGGNYYLEASTLFRTQDGVDVPANFVIPNCKIQSNFNFTMASSGDPSTFTFTMDAFPDYLRFDKSKKVIAAIQLINDNKIDSSTTRDRTKSNLKLK